MINQHIKTCCSFHKKLAGLLILMRCINKLYLFYMDFNTYEARSTYCRLMAIQICQRLVLKWHYVNFNVGMRGQDSFLHRYIFLCTGIVAPHHITWKWLFGVYRLGCDYHKLNLPITFLYMRCLLFIVLNYLETERVPTNVMECTAKPIQSSTYKPAIHTSIGLKVYLICYPFSYRNNYMYLMCI